MNETTVLPTADQAVKLQQQRESLRLAPHFHHQAAQAAKRKADEKKFFEDVLLHIADRYNWHHDFTSPGRARNSWRIGTGIAGDSEWYNYRGRNGRKLKWEPGCNGVQQTSEGIVLSNTRSKRVVLPDISSDLLKDISLTEPHPLGYFCVPVKGQAGVFASFGVVPDYQPIGAHADGGHQWRDVGKWVVVGFCLRGRAVPECVARGTITLADIEREQNTETRQVMVERFGIERYLREAGAVELDHSDFGTLYDIHGMKVVKVINSTPEADGTYKDYFLRVPSNMTSARAAVAWTFGMSADEYQPVSQS